MHYRISRIINKIANEYIDGMRKSKVKRIINDIISKNSKGLYHDDYWNGVHQIFKAFSKYNIDYDITKTRYIKNEDNIPISKEWHIEIEFVNNRGKVNKLYGIITANGAGTVSDPLSSYDIVGYVN